jgi:hypothetical protein
MYRKGCKVDDGLISWACLQLDKFVASRPKTTSLMKYMNDLWRKNNGMWEIGAKKIPYVIQNINAFMESYHSNLKSIQYSFRNYFVGRRIDWLIYHLVGDIITHYSYGVQCKSYRFVHKICIISLAKFCAHVIFDTNIFICWGGMLLTMDR